jgi:hypothetical protein
VLDQRRLGQLKDGLRHQSLIARSAGREDAHTRPPRQQATASNCGLVARSAPPAVAPSRGQPRRETPRSCDTTLDPKNRTLCKVTMEDAAPPTLPRPHGRQVEPAASSSRSMLEVKNLDV